MEKTVEFNFILNKWGGFELGDGEYFRDSMKDLIETKPDFFIFTEEKDGFFETTFVPNPFEKKDMSRWTDKNWIDMFTYAVTYKTSKEQVIERLIGQSNQTKFGIWEIDPNSEIINVDNMFWYYLGLFDTGSLMLKCEAELHPKYAELINLHKN